MSDSKYLVAGEVSTGEFVHIEEEYSRDDGNATYTIKARGGATKFPGLGGGMWVWNLGVTPEIPLSLNIDIGAGSAELNLTSLNIRGLQSRLGVGSMSVTLPDEGNFEAKIDGAVGNIEVIVPEGLAARIHGDGGLVHLEVPDTYNGRDDIYYSPDYDDSKNRVDLEIDMAIGMINVKQTP